MTDHHDIERTAAEWLARRDSGTLSPADEAAFGDWLNASVAHRVSYLRLNATWTRTQRLAALEYRDTFAAHPVATTISRLKHAARGAIAVTCLALACAAGWYGWQYSQSIYRTEIGAMQSLPLADGSRITLNTNSKMRVAIADDRREVDLRQGEAFFEVAHDRARPFLVRTGTVDVEVVGTQFAIHRTHESVRVLVNEGHVRVHALGTGRRRHAMELAAGDVVVLSASGIAHRHATPEELDAALSWRRGQIVFRDTPLMEAVAEFNRYRNKPLVIVDPQLAAMRIGGTFRTGNADGFLQLLQHGFDVTVRTEDDAVLLTRR